MIAHGSPSCSAAAQRTVEQRLRLLEVGVDVDRDVAEEPERERQRERIVHLQRLSRADDRLHRRKNAPRASAGAAVALRQGSMPVVSTMRTWFPPVRLAISRRLRRP